MMITKQNTTEEVGLLSRDLYLQSLIYGVRQDTPEELLCNRTNGRYWMVPLQYFRIRKTLEDIDRSPGYSLGSALVNDYHPISHVYSGNQPDRVFLYAIEHGLVEIGMDKDVERNTVTVFPFKTKGNLEKLLKLLDLPLPNLYKIAEDKNG